MFTLAMAGWLLAQALILPAPLLQEVPAAPPPPATGTGVTAEWHAPAVIWPAEWPDARFYSLSANGARLVALLPDSGSGDYSRHIVVSEMTGGAWQAPVVIAQNGAYSDAGVQALPQRTHPAISGDGKTIAYVGYTGTTFGVYIVDRSASGGWSVPALLNTGLANSHYWISLSRNGSTLALSDYPFIGTQHLYVLTRTGGVWSAPVRISLEDGPNRGGGMPSLSEDGSRLVFISNARVMFSRRDGAGWTPPVAVTTNDAFTTPAEYPQLSGDGMSLAYWLVTLTPKGSAYVRTAQNLYSAWWERDDWGEAQQVNAVPVLPSSVTEGPATANRSGTRLVYSNPITTTDPGSDDPYIYASHLEVGEWSAGGWQTARLVAANGYGNLNRWPRLTPVGRTLTFDGGTRTVNNLPVAGALWQMTTTVSPPVPPNNLSLTTFLSMTGSSLFVPFDFVNYRFDPNTFTTTVTMTHTYWSDPPPPPTGTVGIGGIGGIGGLGGAFGTTLFGPGGLPVQPLRPVTITVDYSGIDTVTTIPGSLNLWWRNDNQWVKLPSIDDPAAGAVMAPVSHFSYFAVFGESRWLYLPCVVR